MKKIIFILFFLLLIFTGCSSVEIEERNFVSTIGFDKSPLGGYLITLGYIVPNEENMYNTETKTINANLSTVNDKIISSDKKQMYFGHLKSIILGKSIVEDKKSLEEILLFSSADNDISMDTIILACDGSAEETSKSVCSVNNGMYIWDFYKNNKNGIYSSFKLTLAETIKQLDNNGSLIIPKIFSDENGTKTEGGIIIGNNFDIMNNDEMQGYMYITENGKGKTETIASGGEINTFSVEKNKTNIKFYKSYDILCVNINLKIKTKPVKKYTDNKKLEKLLAEQIKIKAESAVKKLKQSNSDALGLEYMLMMRKNGLYKKFEGENNFKNMQIKVNVEI